MKKTRSKIRVNNGFAAGLAVAAALLFLAVPKGPSWAGAIEVENATAHLTDSDANGYRIEVYMDISNSGGADRLYAVRTELSQKVMLSIVNDDNTQHEGHHNGMAMPETKHAQTVALEVPAGSSAQLAMGKSHIMVMDPEKLPAAGTSFPVTLFFERAGKVKVDVVMDTADLALQPAQ